MKKLTPREQQALEAIARLWRQRGYPPTLEEIGRVLGIRTRAGVYGHVLALEKKGYVQRGPGRRSLKVLRDVDGSAVPTSEEMVLIPSYDRVRGGPLDLARTDVDEFISVPKDWLRGRSGFAVRVVGDSMAPGLMEGDLAIVRSQGVAQNGDVVVALIGDEATVKRFQRERDRILLIPDNREHKTLEFPGGEGVEILGKVVRSIRALA
jgi:repressor LexA